MDFKDTPEQAQFREQIRAWLKENAQPKTETETVRELSARYQQARAWYKKKAAAGYACLEWPKKYGGAGLTPIHKLIWSQEVAHYDEPDDYFVIGLGNCGPAIMHFTEEPLRSKLLQRMAANEDVWCQLFSEPGAGSDVAGLKTSAKQADNGEWRINGQKIWTSGAAHCDYGVVLCRSDTTVSKYKGLTMFIIDMRQPGVEVRPIKQMDRGQHFNEVFFNDAVVSDQYRLGAVGGGWEAALLVLMNERMAITAAVPNGFAEFFEFVRSAELDGKPIRNHPLVRDRLAEWHCMDAGVRAGFYRMFTAVAQGGMPGAEGAIGKLVAGKMNQDIAQFTLQLMGAAGAIHDPKIAHENAYFQDAILYTPGIRLAGGTDEIMRNIIAEQVLGLPQEPRADKGIAFEDIPSN